MGKEKEIFDLYQWLPEYGENNVLFCFSKNTFTLTVEYDNEDSSEGDYARRNIIFESVCSFEGGVFPGIVLPSNDESVAPQSARDENISLGSLREYTDSKVADMWTQHFKGQYKVRHFQVLFLSENKRFEVFAKDVHMSEAEYFN